VEDDVDSGLAGSEARTEPDWHSWLQRWEAQQSRSLLDREERFEAMIDFLRAAVGTAPTVVDLGCGPGSLAARLADRLPQARIIAVDADPLLLELGRRAVGSRDGRITWVRADLREGSWTDAVEGQADGALSTTALHWLSPEELTALVGRLAALIRPGGVFLDGDHMTFDASERRLAEAAERLTAEFRQEISEAGGEGWHEWWAAVEAEPGFEGLLAERRAAGWSGHPDYHRPGELSFLRALLLRSGFAEAATVWQRLDNRVLAAIR
jgi:trans-aconitate methyltransferase